MPAQKRADSLELGSITAAVINCLGQYGEQLAMAHRFLGTLQHLRFVAFDIESGGQTLPTVPSPLKEECLKYPRRGRALAAATLL